jgi:hypothetical protein
MKHQQNVEFISGRFVNYYFNRNAIITNIFGGLVAGANFYLG